jgi:DNA mismatch repair protein MutS2
MDEKTLTELAFYRIRNSIADLCLSSEAKEELLSREPLTDIHKIEKLKSLSSEWNAFLQSTRTPALTGWNEIQHFLPLMKTEGATLEQEHAYSLAQFCRSVRLADTSILSASETIPMKNLVSLSSLIPTSEIAQAEEKINRIIDANGVLRDLPALRAIRQKIASLHTEIDSILRQYTSDSSLLNVLESNVPAYRADRQVLAVRTSQRSRISGIVHEMSASGQTLYIEPDEVVRRNNDLVQEEFHLQQEIRKLFTDLTAELRPSEPFFESALAVMIQMDMTLAAARWGAENNCVYALACDGDSAPLLLHARHPLLGTKAVPIDVRFLEGKRVLIITGPNTGGKTVTIKTFALLALLNQAGFPVPADEGTRLPIFDSVFADIGDEQSIDQSLSTFSAHMKNIADAVKHAGKDSLVLLDELGSGTDPQEGGAIAMAVLDTLIEKNAFVLVTTHHGILKNYGYTNPSCVNASVDFDTDTLSPTYRLLMGVPGESHAIEIARRSGLDGFVVDKAKSYLTNEQADISTLIKGLTAKHAELAELQKQAETEEYEMREKQRKVDLQELRVRQREHDVKIAEHKSSSSFLAETRKQLENLVRSLRESEITREKTLSVKQFISDLTGAVAAEDEALESEEALLNSDMRAYEERTAAEQKKERGVRSENGILITKDSGARSSNKAHKNAKKKLNAKEAFAQAKSIYDDAAVNTGSSGKSNISAHLGKTSLASSSSSRSYSANSSPNEIPVPSFSPGAEVFAGSSRSRGTLVRLEKKGVWCVQLGSIRMSLRQKDMVLAPPAGAKHLSPLITIEFASGTAEENDVIYKSGLPTDKPVFELRLLGMRAEDAVKSLERQLDLCSIQNFRSFSVIHGKGTGVLQQAVQDTLSHYPGVKEFHFASPEEGGTGKTYVTMN